MVNLQFSAPLEQSTQVRVVDINGKILQTHQLELGRSQWEVPISYLHPGHYFLQIDRGGELEMKRFIKL